MIFPSKKENKLTKFYFYFFLKGNHQYQQRRQPKEPAKNLKNISKNLPSHSEFILVNGFWKFTKGIVICILLSNHEFPGFGGLF